MSLLLYCSLKSTKAVVGLHRCTPAYQASVNHVWYKLGKQFMVANVNLQFMIAYDNLQRMIAHGNLQFVIAYVNLQFTKAWQFMKTYVNLQFTRGSLWQ